MSTSGSQKRIFAIGLLAAFLAACVQKTEVAPVNPHPSDEVIIYGTLPVDRGLDLRMTARFESKNNWCGNFVDVSHIYQLSETIKIDVQKTENRYEARFFRDAFAKGECDWAFIYATAELVDSDAGTSWRTFDGATPEDLKKPHLRGVLHEEEDHHFEVSCSSLSKAQVDSAGDVPARQDLDCGVQGIFLIPGIHKYHVDYDYVER